MNLFILHCRGATVYAAKPNCAEAERRANLFAQPRREQYMRSSRIYAEAERRANLFAQPRREQYMRLFRWIKFLKCSVRVEQCDPSDLFGGYPGQCAGFFRVVRNHLYIIIIHDFLRTADVYMSTLSGKQVSVVGRQGRCRLILFTERLAFAEEEPVGIDRRKLEHIGPLYPHYVRKLSRLKLFELQKLL